MKKTLIALFAIASIAACSKADVVIDSTDKVPISFDQVKTRSLVNNVEDMTAFGVWGQVMDAYNGQLFPLFTNEKVYRDTEAEGVKWTYDNEEYWVDNMTFRFFALHPYELDNEGSRVNITDLESGDKRYEVNFETPETADTDLMAAAREIKIENGNYPETVGLQFSHLLTRVNVKIIKDEDNANDNFYIQSIRMTGIRKSGKYVREQLADSYNSSWSLNSDTFTYQSTFNGTEDLGGGKFLSPDGLLLIPQNLAPQQVMVTISYFFQLDQSDDREPREIQTYLPIEQQWEAGKTITYVAKLSEDNTIKFSAPIVEPWGTPQAGCTIIIK